jgi:hypothetical protein
MSDSNFSMNKSTCKYRLSLPVHDWPDADRRAWEDACRPGSRLKAGGAASALAQASRNDFAIAYGSIPGLLAAKRSA